MEVRNLQASESGAWDEFLTSLHTSPNAAHIRSDIISHPKLHSRYVLEHGDHWIGHGATRVIDVRIGQTAIPFGIIGAIHIDPAYQRMRHTQASTATLQIVEKSLRDLRAAGCVGAIINTDAQTAFKKLGFQPHHNEWWVHIPSSQIESPKRIPTPFFIQHGLTSTCSSFISRQIMHLYEQLPEGARRTSDNWTSILNKNATVYSIVLHKDQMVGYFLMNRIGKRDHVIHECFVPSKEVLYYGTTTLRSYLREDLHILGPESQMRNIVGWSREIFDQSTFYRGNMGMITLFKPHQLLQQWEELNASILKSRQLRTHQTTPISLEFYHHADLVHKLELHKDFHFMFESHVPFLTRRSRPAPILQPIRLYIYWADMLHLNS